jgi:hypothetical protein
MMIMTQTESHYWHLTSWHIVRSEVHTAVFWDDMLWSGTNVSKEHAMTTTLHIEAAIWCLSTEQHSITSQNTRPFITHNVTLNFRCN